MPDTMPGATPDATGLLGDLRDLRARARADRHGYAFPLLLFGVLILAAPLLYSPARPGTEPNPGDNPLVGIFRTMAGGDPAHPTLIAWYWLLVLAAGFGATAWWYRHRAVRVGLETDTRGVLVTAVAAFAGFFLSTYAFSEVAASLYATWYVNLPLLAAALALAGLALWWNRGPVGVFVASAAATVAFASIAVYATKGFSALLVIAGGLLALAWLERSRFLGVVSGLFTLAALPSAISIHTAYLSIHPAAVFWYLGWRYEPGDLRFVVLHELLLPATVLLVGGTIAAFRFRRKEGAT